MVAMGAVWLLGCDLPAWGTAPLDAGPSGIPEIDAALPPHDAGTSGVADGGADAVALADADAASVPPSDAPCPPADGAVVGALSLADFTIAGAAQLNVGNDGLLTLTQAANNVVGAGWYKTPFAAGSAYDMTFTIRESANSVAGAGFTFALVTAPNAPTAAFVGTTGDAMGLRGIPGATGGYAVGLYLYAGINFQLFSMPDFTAVASQTMAGAINDGTSYEVDVSWRAPSTLTATLRLPGGPLTVTSSDARFASPGPAWLGVTAATGPASNAHNELATATVVDVCP
jgi:hypothetical protein